MMNPEPPRSVANQPRIPDVRRLLAVTPKADPEDKGTDEEKHRQSRKREADEEEEHLSPFDEEIHVERREPHDPSEGDDDDGDTFSLNVLA